MISLLTQKIKKTHNCANNYLWIESVWFLVRIRCKATKSTAEDIMPSNQAYNWPKYSVCPFFSGWTTWSNKFIFILKNRLLTISEMYFFGTGKKEWSCSRLMERDILNQRTDSDGHGLSYLYTICVLLWRNRFLKKIKFNFMAYIDQK